MLTWTSAGAVPHPTLLQLRVQRSYPGRVRAGAPVPTRSMSAEEILSNLIYFTEGMRGGRARPCDGLVLSGVGVATREDVLGHLDAARGLGILRRVLHAGPEDLEAFVAERFRDRVEQVVVPVQPGSAGGALVAGARVIRECRDAGIAVAANTVLSTLAVPELPVVARALAVAAPTTATFTFPFPIAGNTSTEVPGIASVLAALGGAVPVLERAGVRVEVKGLPACYLGRHASLLRRSRNRWYVDADHQREQALRFFPDVAAFTKLEVCRFCAADGMCDGFFATYLRRPGFPPLAAVDAPEA